MRNGDQSSVHLWTPIDKPSPNSLVRIYVFISGANSQALTLTGKITSTGSTNIFANREYETLLRSLNLRRLSYVIFTGDKNHFLTQLPSIQEKLVDIIRNPNSPLMQSEVRHIRDKNAFLSSPDRFTSVCGSYFVVYHPITCLVSGL